MIKKIVKYRSKILIILIFIIGLVLRLHGINWDQGLHLHPDERMILMVTERIHFFDKLNPNFFNYGSFPIYFLKATDQFIGSIIFPDIAPYDRVLAIGRIWAVLFDFFTLIFVYKLAKIVIKNERVALFSTLIYAIAFFPIQNSHFYIVDGLLTMCSTLLVIYIIRTTNKPALNTLITMSFIAAIMLTTKATAVIFLPAVYIVLLLKKGALNLKLKGTIIFTLSTLIFSLIFMPYAFINYQKFFTDISTQIKMNGSPYLFPYTLQYVNTIPYWYFLKNIFFWGLGPFISLLTIAGVYIFFKQKLFKHKNVLIVFIYYIIFFTVIGRSSVKFMRYMLPLYPFFALLSGIALSAAVSQKQKIIVLVFRIILFCTIIWTLAFIDIYNQKHTRIIASDWINTNVPIKSKIAVEYWDDYLPLNNTNRYKFIELNLYTQPDSVFKWKILNEKLRHAQYLVIASNRVYKPLQKLGNCSQNQICFPLTDSYYRTLFTGKSDFKKVAEFAVYPKIKLFDILFFEINDQSADESFTVFDHPKIMIFKNQKSS